MDFILCSRLNEDLAYKIMKDVHRHNMRSSLEKINRVSWVWTKTEGYSWLCL